MIEIDKNKTSGELCTEIDILKASIDRGKFPIISNLTYARKSKITKDFESYLCPEFEFNREQFKKERAAVAFSKFIGPLGASVQINFFIRFDFYEFTYRIKNWLYRPLRLSSDLRYFIRVQHCMELLEHEIGKYRIMIQSLRQNSILPLFRSVSINEIFETYRYHMSDFPRNIRRFGGASRIETEACFRERLQVKPGREPLEGSEWECATPALIAAWGGDKYLAEEYLEWGMDIMESMHEYAKRYNPHPDEWWKMHKEMIDNPEMLRQNFRDNIREYGLEYAPYRDIIGVPYKEKDIPNKNMKGIRTDPWWIERS